MLKYGGEPSETKSSCPHGAYRLAGKSSGSQGYTAERPRALVSLRWSLSPAVPLTAETFLNSLVTALLKRKTEG